MIKKRQKNNVKNFSVKPENYMKWINWKTISRKTKSKTKSLFKAVIQIKEHPVWYTNAVEESCSVYHRLAFYCFILVKLFSQLIRCSVTFLYAAEKEYRSKYR